MLKKLLAVLVLTVLSAYAQTPVVGGEGGGGGTWGSITGTLSSQTDLQAALDAKGDLDSTDIDTSAEIKAIVTDETGSGGALVFATSPTLTTPNIGAATATSINGITVTSSAGSTVTIAAGKTVTINHGITISGGDSTVLTFPNDSVTFTATPTADAGVIAGADNLIADGWLPAASGVLEWFIQTPAVAASHIIMKSLPDMQAGTITALHCQACNELACSTTTAAVAINLDARAFSTPGSAGTDLHTSEFTCDEDGFTTTTFAGDATNAANEAWNLSISSVTDATILRVWATVEID